MGTPINNSTEQQVAARIVGILNEAQQERTRSPEADRLELLKGVLHAGNDDLMTVQALLAAVRALAIERDESDTERLLEIVGAKLDDVLQVFADHV